MELTFEKARPEDVPCIFNLCKDLIDRYEDVQSIPYDGVLQWVRRKIENGIEEYTCVYCDGEKAGYYRFGPEGERMELDDLYVLEGFQNRGIGTQILKKCLAETDKTVFLYVFRKNVRAIALYQRMGLRITESAGNTRFIMTKTAEDRNHG